MNLYSFSLLLFSFGTLLIALLVFVKRKDPVGIRFLFFSVSASGWSFFRSFWMTQNYSIETSLLLARVSHIFAVFIPVTWLHFVFVFIGKKEPFKYFYLTNYLFALFLLTLIPTPFFIRGMHSVMEFKYYTSPGPLYHLFTLIFSFYVPYSFFYLGQSYQASIGQTRQQLKQLLLAMGIIFTAGSTTLIPVYKIPAPLFLVAFMPFYPLLMGIALIRHGLFDAYDIADACQRERLAVIGTLAASVNHEIRNPLFIVKGFTERLLNHLKNGSLELLSHEERNQNVEEVLVKIIQQMDRAVDMTKRLTDLSKPASVAATSEMAHLGKIIDNILCFIRYGLEKDSIKVENKIDGDIAVYANQKELEQIFLNLIMNACQAMPNGGQLTIANKQHNNRVSIDVSDTGEGIPPDQISRIFEPFFTTKKEKGTGLGLYIVKKLVERNGGKIEVTSDVGRGATFRIGFPLANA